MPRSTVRIASDYNRGLFPPVRWAHVAWAAIGGAAAARWINDRRRRTWTIPLVLGVIGFALVLPFDAALLPTDAWRDRYIGGDLRRELEAVQQYGQFTVSLLVALTIWLLDPSGRRRLADWVLAMLAAAAVLYPMKLLVGRPRPKYDDPWVFLGPWGEYPLGDGRGIHHAWDLGARISSDLHSMPSSHTVFAVVLSVFLSRMYPRLTPVAVALAVVVGLARVLLGGHWASDVVVGAAIGAACAGVVIDRQWGQRLLDRLPARSPAAASDGRGRRGRRGLP